jgi:hypothetical protein
MACPEPCNKFPFSAFTVALSLAFKGEWLDLAYGISGIWVLSPKLLFQKCFVKEKDNASFS